MFHLNWATISAALMSVGAAGALITGSAAGVRHVTKKVAPFVIDRKKIALTLNTQEKEITAMRDLLKRADESLRVSKESFDNVISVVTALNDKIDLLQERLTQVEAQWREGVKWIAGVFEDHEDSLHSLRPLPDILRDPVDEALRVGAT